MTDKPRLASPYLAPGFYDRALAQGRHRDIVGGRWEETGRLQLALLQSAGLQPHHHVLDIGAGSLRLGCLAVPYLHPGHYWATDASRALMLRGRETELPDPDALPLTHLVEDHAFALPGVPATIDFAISFAVFTHLTADHLTIALNSLQVRCPGLQYFLFTVFLVDPDKQDQPCRQPDGVVTHPERPPYHVTLDALQHRIAQAGWDIARQPDRLPRGQVLFQASLPN